jgi:hypothetical protein
MRQFSVETRRKMSLAKKGKTLPLAWRRNIALAGIGRKHSEESKRKIAASRIGKKRNFTQEWLNNIYSAWGGKQIPGGNGGSLSPYEQEVSMSLLPLGFEMHQKIKVSSLLFRRGFYQCDFINKEDGIIVEVNGPYHNKPSMIKADTRKRKILEDMGWKVFIIKHKYNQFPDHRQGFRAPHRV